MDKKQLKTIPGSDKNSTFYVLGSTEELDCSFRAWVDFEPKRTLICFRIRITLADGAITPWNLEEFVSSRLPGLVWSGRSDKHVSLSGVAVLPIGGAKAPYSAVMNMLQLNKIDANLYEFLKEKLAIFDFLFTGQEFMEFFADEVHQCYKAIYDKPEESAVILEMGSYKKSFANGKEVLEQTTVEEEDPLASLGLGG